VVDTFVENTYVINTYGAKACGGGVKEWTSGGG